MSFTVHHVRREDYFQTEPKYLMIFQFEKQDGTMIKEYKKKEMADQSFCVFIRSFQLAKPGEFKTDKNKENIYISVFHLLST